MRTWLPRVTVATIVERDGLFLMVEEDVHGELKLNQPAGHLEADETLIEAAARETLEETAWQVEIDYLVEFSQWTSESGNHYLRACFAGTALELIPDQTLDDGILRAVWLSRDEVAARQEQLRSPLVLHHIDHYINGKQTPLEIFSYYD
ncbi:NUDIX hydrolase [Marinicella gelatinilytica]|uniref:NUDIX hydrolase n=1 Tax=Marinicella gelatinilytica TaxID=2996017 RepID=UPI0022608BCF|nr:NUDIX hydrolase [Marinicella gelatinilytica]MCX7543937.1 NUDIX hydrolase [Marinicella gelatinilytica]